MTTTIKTKRQAAHSLIGNYIDLVFSDESKMASRIGGLLHAFFDYPYTSSQHLFSYHSNLMQLFKALAKPEVATVLRDEMKAGHYEEFVCMMERLVNMIRDISEDQAILACMDFELMNPDAIQDVYDGEEERLKAKYKDLLKAFA